MSLIFILLGTFFLLAFLGVPIAVSLGVASGVGMLACDVQLTGIAQRMFAGVDSFSYLAIPMFMLAGKLMEYGGISARIVQVAKLLCAKVRGGLAITTIVACSFFAALSGSAPATVSAIGGIMYPEMLKDGYDEEFAGGMISVAGNLGPLIPPSILMVTIGVCTGVSISDMFLGGIVIGILLAIALCLTAYIICRRRNYGGSHEQHAKGEVFKIIWSALPALGMPVIILGGIYGGIFTPTEASVVAVVYGILVSFLIYREMTVRQFISALVDSAVAGSVILLMISTSMAFSWIFARQGLSTLVVSSVSSVFTTATSFMILSFVIFLIFGTPFPPLTTTAFPVFSPEEEVVPLPDEEDAEDVEELLCVPTLHRTMHTPFLVPSVTSTLTVPWEMAVTLPLLSTDAMPSSSLIQV